VSSHPRIASAALSRAVLLARVAVTVAGAGAGVLQVDVPWRLVELVAVVIALAAVEVAVLTSWPQIVRWPVTVVVVDSVGLVAVLAVGGPGIAYFSYAAGCAALAGALLGLRAWPVWVAQTVLGFAVAAEFLADTQAVPELAVFVLALPTASVVAGIGLAVARTALDRHMRFTVRLVASAQRSAAASERARLARELHDSVTKTLRGVSFAALALPSSLRRHPDLAEQLADTVSKGAKAAAREAQELVAGLRLDNPEEAYIDRMAEICRAWSESSGISVNLDLRCVDPPIAVRYELTRILQEALANVERHASARCVLVTLAPSGAELHLCVSDDGRGMPSPPPGPATGHFGIVGMSERAKAIGGTLVFGAGSGGGTELVVSVPAHHATSPADGGLLAGMDF
jgi:signal transduction histidine kinase